MEKRELICIGCPLGCMITVNFEEDGSVKDVAGNTCAKGDAYARKEVTDPTRIVTSTIRVSGGDKPMVSVKTKNDIPKIKIMDCMSCINAARIKAPVHIGDVLLPDVAGTGVDVIATRNVEAAGEA